MLTPVVGYLVGRRLRPRRHNRRKRRRRRRAKDV